MSEVQRGDDGGSALQRLLDHAEGPLGPEGKGSFDVPHGPLVELAALLSRMNGFTAFHRGLHVFRAGPIGLGPELQQWNDFGLWKDTYNGIADDLLCFAQDLFGVQFAVDSRLQVLAFDPETTRRYVIGASLEAWASWVLSDLDHRACASLAHEWQAQHGPLDHHQRLLPIQFFARGGRYEVANLVARDAVTCMRVRGPIARVA